LQVRRASKQIAENGRQHLFNIVPHSHESGRYEFREKFFRSILDGDGSSWYRIVAQARDHRIP